MEQLEAKQQELLRSYKAMVDRLLTCHLVGPEPVDWHAAKSSPPPPPPARVTSRSDPVHVELYQFEPSVLDRLLFRVGRKRSELERRLREAEDADEVEYQELLAKHAEVLESHGLLARLAPGVLSNDADVWIEAFQALNTASDRLPVEGVKLELHADQEGADLTVSLVATVLRASLPDDAVQEVADGKLELVKLGRNGVSDRFEDYACSVALRLAREAFAVLPTPRVSVQTVESVLNTATGHEEERELVRAEIGRAEFEALNLERIDPSDALSAFDSVNHLAGVNPWRPRTP